MVFRLFSFLFLFTSTLCTVLSQGFVDFARTTQGNIEMTVNNLGIIGNSFRGVYLPANGGFGSCEFPKGSGIEHLFNGGLWVGGLIDGNVVAVSTGAVSSSQGYATGAAGYEFTAPIGSRLRFRSSLLDNEFYSPTAVSHQDIIGNFTDKNILVPGSQQQITGHTNPLGLDIEMQVYNWNFTSANFFIPITFKIKNTGGKRIDSVYIGFWSDFVVRNININPPGGTPFFSGGGNGYIDSLDIAYEWDAENITANARSYVGVKYLGSVKNNQFYSKKSVNNFRVMYNTWLFSSGTTYLFRPENDNQYYGRLSSGLNQRSDWNIIQQELAIHGNRSNLLSVGPYATLSANEEIEISFAIVCAQPADDGRAFHLNTPQQRVNFLRNVQSVQSSYLGEDRNGNGILDAGEDFNNNGKIDRWIFPEPPSIPKTKVLANDGSIEIYWSDNADKSTDPVTGLQDFEGYRIYRTQLGFDVAGDRDIEQNLQLVAAFDLPGNRLFFDTGLDSIKLALPVTFEGDTTTYHYKYVIKNVANGWQHAIAVTAFDRGNPATNLPSLESSKLANLYRVFPGTPANANINENEPFVYPNPYYGFAAWEGKSLLEEDRKITFANLPKNCKVKVFTYAGDPVYEFTHTGTNKDASTRWYRTYADQSRNTVFSGGEHSWNLLSGSTQLIARGIYLFSVEDTDTGNTYIGKFVIVK